MKALAYWKNHHHLQVYYLTISYYPQAFLPERLVVISVDEHPRQATLYSSCSA